MMMRALTGFTLLAGLSAQAIAQTPSPVPASTPAPAFDAADVHISPHRTFPFKSGGLLHGDRYILHQATMLDLVSAAYGVDDTTVQSGPIWLETDRFDIIAKAPPTTSKSDIKLMLQALLAERFHLVVHNGSKPMPAYMLTVAKGKPKFALSDGTASASCRYQAPQTPGPTPNITFACHNTTMATLAQKLRDWPTGGYIAYPVIDATNLKDSYDFNIQWTYFGALQQAGADGINLFDAVQNQLGLKLDLQTAPRTVLLVDSVDQKPTPNAIGLEKILPPAPPPEFEVATIKPTKPDAPIRSTIRDTQIDVQGMPLKFMITFAWDLNPNDSEALVGAPKWLESDRFDILAKVAEDPPVPGQTGTQMDPENLRAMLRALLIDRFQIKAHTEDRPVSAYTLIAVNPKLRKADPLSRTRCTEGPGPDGKDPRTANPMLNRLLTCQNMTMAQIGDELQRVAAGYIYNPVLDGTEIKGSWDFTLSFSSADKVQAGAGPSAPSANGGSTASDPSGALSLFDAVSRQLGLRLEKQKRPLPVLVIDHIEEKPTDN